MRGVLVVNPNASTTSPRVREVLAGALAHQIRLDVVETSHRGHAAEIGAAARAEGADCVIALGGDGTVNEVVNGMLDHGGPGADVPALGVIPAGSANVFARALGFPPDPIEATGELISRLKARSVRRVGLGRANGRYFTINAGIGIDAEIIAAMERARVDGKSATTARYLATTIRRLSQTDRKVPHLAIAVPGKPLIRGVFVAFVQNTAPWTYMGALPVNPLPHASFDKGLDVWGARSLALPAIVSHARRMLQGATGGSNRRVVTLHDVAALTIMCDQPMRLQIDGEGLGETERVDFQAIPNALRVVA